MRCQQKLQESDRKRTFDDQQLFKLCSFIKNNCEIIFDRFANCVLSELSILLIYMGKLGIKMSYQFDQIFLLLLTFSFQMAEEFKKNYECTENQGPSVYFLQGNDPKQLTFDQQAQVADFIAKDNLIPSFLVYNPAEMLRRMTNWKNNFPWIQPFYAVKASPQIDFIKDLHNQGAGMDCASKSEIELALRVGIPIDQIIYSNSIKIEKDLIWAGKIGIKYTTADNIDQLMKIKKYAPQIGVFWRISIKQVQTDILTSQFSKKFGDHLEDDEAIHRRMKQIQELRVSLKGIHFHCGSGINGSTGFQRAVKIARRCIEIGRLYGHEMHTLDIGGGFPSGDIPQSTIDALKPTKDDPLNYRTVAQPGRHLASHCFHVATRVIGKSMRGQSPCYYVNDSVFHSFNCVLVDGVSFDDSDQFYSKVLDGNKMEISDIRNSTLFGMTCDGMDIISKNFRVPFGAKIGDWFCFGGMGAYTYSIKTNFNGMSTTEETFILSTLKQSEKQ